VSAVGAIVHWANAPVAEDALRRMMDVVTYRGPDGMHQETSGAIGLGHGLLALRQAELEQTPQPVWLPDRSAVVVADCRLDNRATLRRTLGKSSWLPRDSSDAELILAAYEEWDLELVQHLLGDFAFVIWDADRRRVVAARDPFGVRPLFFHWSPQRLVLGSEPKQLLALPEISGEVDPLIVGEFLFRKFEDTERTFHTSVRRLRPAHLLVATERGCEQSRYWRPDPSAEARFEQPREYSLRFRDLLAESVRARLETDFPAAAHLSGGLDSSAIAVLAAAELGSMAAPSPPFFLLSGLFPGLDCDETRFIRAVESHTGLDVRTFEPLQSPLLSELREDIALMSSPFIDLQRGSWMREAEILQETSSRTLLTGLGGDELLHEEYYLRDLALRRRFPTLVREAHLASRYSWNSLGWLLGDALKPLAPEWARTARRGLRRSPGWVAPGWAQPEFADFFESCPEVPIEPDPGFQSLVQEWAFRWLNYPTLCWALEAAEVHAAAAGVSISHPFLDRRLAEYVLSIPFDARLPRGRWKVLIRDGLSDLLPALVRDRTRKTSFSSLHLEIMRRDQDALVRELSSEPEWHSAAFTDGAAVLHDLGALTGRAESEISEIDALWRAGTLELWMRYSASAL
jgi:asparagine synthase (glutamine-hydrolysing)